VRFLLIVAVALAGCGFKADSEGRVRVPLGDGRCEIVAGDTLGPSPRYHGGPSPKDHESYEGYVCDIYRW
jgi:hypothetical protein